uniref:Nucelotide kinase n=1 Tax=Myoviridae sp. ctv1i11 TaxID=2826709 RepID=A0A8S5MV27_9CAUD|nr:MAG TPA: nucelotide kinase [Myoviridae sp. ctv1i11]
MSRICKTCGSLFKATGNEQECPTCKEGFNEIMDIIKGRDSKNTVKDSKKTEAPPTTPEPSPKMTICKVCGKEFEQTGKGRPAVNCPECREALKHEYKMPAKAKPKAKTKATPTVVVATDEDKAKQYGKIEVKPEVTETPTIDVPVVDGALNETMTDAVHHPSHYTLPGLTIESVDVIRAVLTPEEFKGWCKGNALKYSLRAGRKDPAKEVQDLAKAGVFLSWITGE